MDTQLDVPVEPGAILDAKIEPQVDLKKIHLISSPQAFESCPLWVTVGKPGTLEPLSLLDEDWFSNMIAKITKEGLQISLPLLLADTRQGPDGRMFYIAPLPPASDFKQQALWVEQLSKAIIDMGRPRIGFYIEPGLTSLNIVEELLHECIFRMLTLSDRITELYFWVGDFNYNFLLNIALELKADLQGKKSLEIWH